MTDILAGVRACNQPAMPITQNNSELLRTGIGRGTAPAFTTDALVASVKGRGLIKEGMHGHHIQALFDGIAEIDERIHAYGPRPVIRASIPALNDPTAPFNGKTIRGVLREAGLTVQEAESCGSALSSLTPILPHMRKAILSASGSTRVATFKATRIIAQAILDELNKLEADVMASAPEEQAQREYDSMVQSLNSAKRQKKEALARFGADAINNYCLAVDNATTKAEMRRMQEMILSAAKKGKAEK